MKNSQLYSLLGFLIGWGAPVGAMVLRFFSQLPSLEIVPFVREEWSRNYFFYWYMLIGTCLVLTYVGFLLGRHEDREAKRHQERVGS